MNSDIISYYKDRAPEYEKVYSKPERQSDLVLATQILQEIFTDKEVFEIACGTGYWTEKIGKAAREVLATDINDSVLEVAKSKNYSPANIEFQTADIFNLANINKHESLFGSFIWSHIKLQDLNNFMDIANSLVKSSGTIAFMDNNYVEGSNLPVTGTDDLGNTYQTRVLENGTTHQVLKNFPSEKYIKELLTDNACSIKFIKLEYYSILKYNTI